MWDFPPGNSFVHLSESCSPGCEDQVSRAVLAQEMEMLSSALCKKKYLCASACRLHVRDPEEGIGSHGAGVRGACRAQLVMGVL